MKNLETQTSFSAQEAAQILGVHPETVRRMIRTGRLRAARGRRGRASIISRMDLEALYKGQGGGSLFPDILRHALELHALNTFQGVLQNLSRPRRR
jgi:excisionase family DNA binding protein